jgi:hypothetical protein
MSRKEVVNQSKPSTGKENVQKAAGEKKAGNDDQKTKNTNCHFIFPFCLSVGLSFPSKINILLCLHLHHAPFRVLQYW